MTQIINEPKDAISQTLNGVQFIHQDKLEGSVAKFKNQIQGL